MTTPRRGWRAVTERILEAAVSKLRERIDTGSARIDRATVGDAAVRAGDCGADLHDAGVEKGFVVADDAPGVALKALGDDTGTRERSARQAEDRHP